MEFNGILCKHYFYLRVDENESDFCSDFMIFLDSDFIILTLMFQDF